MSLSPLQHGAGSSFWLEVMGALGVEWGENTLPESQGDAQKGRAAQGGPLGIFFFLPLI